jgi:hypothetical protein
MICLGKINKNTFNYNFLFSLKQYIIISYSYSEILKNHFLSSGIIFRINFVTNIKISECINV